MRTVLTTDLDNTMIYSYKHDIGEGKQCVEIYQERELSFVSQKTFEGLKKACEKVMFVPVTTRTLEQYRRIDFKLIRPKYALACNGGQLLVDGAPDAEWLKTSKELIAGSLEELNKAMKILDKEEKRYFELRFIDELFIFTKCKEPESVVEALKKALNTTLVDVFNNGDKVYVLPCSLNKGVAIQRFREYIKADRIIAAGDSEFDISMLKAADVALSQYGFSEKYAIDFEIIEAKEKELLSEAVLDYIISKE